MTSPACQRPMMRSPAPAIRVIFSLSMRVPGTGNL